MFCSIVYSQGYVFRKTDPAPCSGGQDGETRCVEWPKAPWQSPLMLVRNACLPGESLVHLRCRIQAPWFEDEVRNVNSPDLQNHMNRKIRPYAISYYNPDMVYKPEIIKDHVVLKGRMGHPRVQTARSF